ncbi:MAG: hypothetical protein AB2793_03105 [Candidatus Thiodiazotropha sp.]
MSNAESLLNEFSFVADDIALIEESSLELCNDDDVFEDHDIDPKIVNLMHEITRKIIIK